MAKNTVETLLLLKRLIEFIETEKNIPKMSVIGAAAQLSETSKQAGRLEVISALVDFIKKENNG